MMMRGERGERERETTSSGPKQRQIAPSFVMFHFPFSLRVPSGRKLTVYITKRGQRRDSLFHVSAIYNDDITLFVFVCLHIKKGTR